MKTTKKLIVLVFAVFMILLTSQVVGAEGQKYLSRGETNAGEEPPIVESTQTSSKNGTCNGTLEQTWEQEQKMNGTTEGGSLTKNQDGELKQWRYQYRHQIQSGVENETVVMECNLSAKNGQTYVYNHEYQKGMAVEVSEQNKNKLEIKVSAEFKEGKVLVLNVEKNAFEVKNSQKVIVKFDGKEIPEGDIEDVVMGNGTQAKYAKALGEDGGQYIV